MSEQIKVGVTAFITNSLGQVLLGKKKRAYKPELVGKWVTPGGRVNLNEKLVDAIKREVKEETGIDVEINGVLTTGEIIDEGDHFVFIAYAASVLDDEQPITSADDLEDARWFDIEDIPANLTEFTKEVINAAFPDGLGEEEVFNKP